MKETLLRLRVIIPQQQPALPPHGPQADPASQPAPDPQVYSLVRQQYSPAKGWKARVMPYTRTRSLDAILRLRSLYEAIAQENGYGPDSVQYAIHYGISSTP